MLDLLIDLNHEGTTIAIITHDRDIAAQLPRRVELREGAIIADQHTHRHLHQGTLQ